MEKIRITVLTAYIVIGAVFSGCIEEKVDGAVFVPLDLRCEYISNPLGIDATSPRLSWDIQHHERGQLQSAYQILVASSRKNLDADHGDKWDSGKVMSGQSINVAYEGEPLSSGETCYWKVRVWDKDGNASKYSEVATFEMGLLEQSDWRAEWIGAEDKSISAPLLRKGFVLDKEVKKARTYISGLGYYELYINGDRVGDHVLDPGTTDYYKRALYATYDVTGHLKKGENAIGVMLGNGWFSPEKEVIEQSPAPLRAYGDEPKLILQLNMELADGSNSSIVTDGDWKVSDGPIISNSIWNGEIYDARLEKPGWDAPGYDDSDWDHAITLEPPSGVLDSQLMPPIRVIDTLKPVGITEPKDNVYVFDFGQNFAGWPKLSVSGPRGTRVTIRTAEITKRDMALLQDKSTEGVEGTIDPSPNRAAKATDVYILKGEGTEVYEPRFTYHGFRYVQVEGFPGRPTPESLEARVVHSAVEPVGNFTSSNPLINQIHHNIIWGQLSNLFSIPTDCPQRDERMGWMGDAQLSAEEAMYNFDMAAFYTNFLEDVRDSQMDDGSIPDVVPPHWPIYPGTPAWQVAYPLIVWYVYQYYGDQRVLEEHYSSIKRWVDYLGTTAKNHIVEWGRGDWCPPMSTEPTDGSVPITSTGYYYLGAQIVSKAAEILGKPEDAEHYSSLAERIKDALNARFLNKETNQYGTGSQTSNACPLYLGIVPEANEAEVVRNLVKNIMVDHDGHLWAGILGTKYLVETLTELGWGDVMYEITTQTTYPGWGYMISKGATTLWERWGGYLYFDASMNSLNHIMFGSVDEFFYKHLAGIRPASPGYREIIIKPYVLGDLKWVNSSVETVRGTVSSSWMKDDGSVALNVTIPVNSKARVSVPKTGLKNVSVKESGRTAWENGSFIEGIAGITGAEENENYVTFEVGSGSYSFRLTGASSGALKPIQYEGLEVPPTAKANEDLTVSAAVKNMADENLFSEAELYVDGKVVDSKNVVLGSGEIGRISLTLKLYEPGAHKVTIGDLPPKTVTVNPRLLSTTI